MLNSLSDLYKNGNHAQGWELYQKLEQPTPTEDRIGGLCLWNLTRYEEAKIPLYRAAQRGELSAAVDLIAIHLHLNEFDEAQEWISTTQHLQLCPKEQARALAIQGDLHLKLNQLRLAIKVLKQAWVQANIAEDHVSLVPQVAQSLTWALHLAGRDKEALSYINKAVSNTSASLHIYAYLKITQGLISIFNNKLQEAKESLLEIHKTVQGQHFYASYFHLVSGFYNLAHKNMSEVLANLSVASYEAEKVDNKELIVLTGSFFAAASVASSNLDQARAALMPLAHLDLSPSEEATRQLRLGQLHTATKDFDSARIALESAIAAFATLEHQRELSWALLRLAHLHLERGDLKLCNQTLERVSDLVNGVGSAAFLIPELNLLGDETMQRLAAVASPYAMHALMPGLEPEKAAAIPLEARPVVRRLRLVTLGKPQLLADERNVSPRLNKAMELIAYLCLHPQTTLERILDSVFPESDTKAAANYFHQLRHRISKEIPELRVTQDKQTKAYSLDSGTVPLECDYEDVVKLLNHATQNELHQALELYRGAFMPHVESDWAEEVRSNVEWLLVRSGLRVVQDLYERGNFEDCRKLTEKLRKVAPLDEGLNELLVRATNEIDGLLAARRTLSDVEKYFQHEVGELPPALENLKREIKLNLN